MSDNIGSASLLIVPTFDGLSAKVDAALGASSATASKSGSKLGQSTAGGFGKGLTASGAVIGAFSSITSAAMSSISSHVDSAISRFDTLNNYPKVMQSLGYTSAQAESSISKMSDRLSSLPTKLDDMASTVQGIVAVTGDLDQATDAGLALNDMLIASGSSTQLTNAAMEQFRQMLSKGKPELQDWKSLTQAMPGQMNQLAEAMLGAGATASDLYTALGGGGAEATVSMDELLNKMIELDQTGGGSITSFKEQAETAAGGISTSMSNLSNSVTKGITGVLDSVGKDNIATVLGDLKTGVNDAFSAIQTAVSAAMPYVKQFYDVFKSNSGTIAAGVGTFAALSVGTDTLRTAFGNLANTNAKTKSGFDKVKSGASDAAAAFSLVRDGSATVREGLSLVGDSAKTMGTGLKGVFSGLVSAIDPVSLAITGVTAAISIGVAAYTDWKTKTDNLAQATDGLNDAVSRTTALADYSGTLSNVGETAGTSAKSVDELNESLAKSAETMNSTAAEAETSIATLNTAQRIIDDCAGKTDLSAEAQGRLEWALKQVNDQFGTTYTAADVANNAYDENGEHVEDLKAKIDDLIESKKTELKTQALTENLTEAYKNQADAAKTLAEAQAKYDEKMATHDKYIEEAAKWGKSASEAEQMWKNSIKDVTDELNGAQTAYDNQNANVSKLEASLGNANTTAQSYGETLKALAEDKLPAIEGALDNSGQSIGEFGSKLDALGVNTEQLNSKSAAELTSLANSFDGTAASIVGKLDEWGISMDETAKKTAYDVQDMKTSFSDAGIADTLDGLGTSVSDFAGRCSDAGLTAEDFSGMTADNFQQLADACGGDIDAIIESIALFNSTPLVDKDGNVNVEDSTLVDTNGHIYTYNETGLYDKTAGAYVDSASVTDSTGTVWEWNGTALVSKSADATITGNAVTGDAQGRAENTQAAIDRLSSKTVDAQVNGNASDGSAASNIWNTVNGISSLVGKTVDVVTNTFNNIVNTVTNRQNAAGGIRPHAAGGIRYHAGGAIVNRPGSGVPLDIVGEDGAEAIIPLTNKRYVTPFARAVAEQMGEVGGSSDVIAAVAALAEGIKNMETAVYIDGRKLASTIAKPMNQQLGRLSARGC